MVHIPNISLEVSTRELREARVAKGDRTWRTILLEALDVKEDPRTYGPPPRVAATR